MALVVAGSDQHSRLAVVTGASGFIGRQLCASLRAAGYRVRAVVRPDTAARAEDIGADDMVCASLDASALTAAFADAAVVFHLAGIAHTGVRNRSLLRSVNVEGTAAVARAAAAAGVTTLVYFSSVMALNPGQSAYADSKRQGEAALRESAGTSLATVILRPVNVYGPGMRGNLSTMARLIMARCLPPLPRLDNRLAMVSVQDVCRAAVAVAAQPRCAGKAYTVSDGQYYTPTAIEAAIYQGLGRNKPSWHTPRVLFLAAAGAAELAGKLGLTRSSFGLGTYRNLVSDQQVAIDELQQDSGYTPSLTLYDALPDILNSLR